MPSVSKLKAYAVVLYVRSKGAKYDPLPYACVVHADCINNAHSEAIAFVDHWYMEVCYVWAVTEVPTNATLVMNERKENVS